MIYCIGDSFTYGEELADRSKAWPIVLGQLLDRPVTNLGKPATGNYRMVKRTMDSVFKGDAELIVIGWSDPARQEFGDDISICDLWAGRRFRGGQSASDHRMDLIKYMTAYDVPGYYYAKWLRQIILIQSFCRANNVKCIMFSACNAEDYNKKFDNKLVNSVDTSTYIDWPMMGASDWTYGTPHGPGGHFLDDGHRIVAERLNEHIRNIGWLP